MILLQQFVLALCLVKNHCVGELTDWSMIKSTRHFAIFIRPRLLLWIWGSMLELYLLLLHQKMEKP